jgi:hypothetical protein
MLLKNPEGTFLIPVEQYTREKNSPLPDCACEIFKKRALMEIYRGYYSTGFKTSSAFSFSIGSLRLLVSLSSSSET